MNIAQGRPRSWTPQIILFSIIVHAVVLYYVAVAFQVIPPLVPTTEEPRSIPTVMFQPPPPKIIPLEEPKKRPRFQQREPLTPPVQPLVQPTPLPSTVTPMTNGVPSIDVQQPIAEEPVSQLLPRYPRTAETRQIEGRVRLSVTIMPDGSVRNVRILDARPSGYFEAEAVRAVQQWRYKPSNVIRTNVVVDIDFVLH
jgi:protein TonB